MAGDRLSRQLAGMQDAAQGVPEPTIASAKLGALLAEMEALMRVMPAARAEDLRNRADYVAQIEDDAVEAGFDNMPV